MTLLFCAVAAFAGSSADVVRLAEKDGLPSSKVLCVAAAPEEIWIGTEKGLCVADAKTLLVRAAAPSLAGVRITRLALSGAAPWVGTERGLFRIENGAAVAADPPGVARRVTSLAASAQAVWLGRDDGLFRCALPERTWSSVAPKAGAAPWKVRSLALDGAQLLVGLAGPAPAVVETESLRIRFERAAGDAHSTIACLSWAGLFVFGTDGGGVQIFDRSTGAWSAHTSNERTGLTDDFFQGLAGDGLDIWCGTFGGVNLYDAAAGRFANDRIPAALAQSSVWAIDAAPTMLWFGTDGDGLIGLLRERPYARLDSPPTIFDPAATAIVAGAAGPGPTLRQIRFAAASLPEVRFDAVPLPEPDVMLRPDQLGLAGASLPAASLADGEYLVEMTVRDPAGRQSAARTVLRKDTKDPDLTLEVAPAAIEPGPYLLKGRSSEPLSSVAFDPPRDEEIRLDASGRIFEASLTLGLGTHTAKIVASDRSGRLGRAETTLDVRRPESGMQVTEAAREVRILIAERILFHPGSADLDSDGAAVLSRVADVLSKYVDAQITVEGHTDNLPLRAGAAFADNLALSKARADSVRVSLVARDIFEGRIASAGFGDTRPIASNTTDAGRRDNRRVEIRVKR